MPPSFETTVVPAAPTATTRVADANAAASSQALAAAAFAGCRRERCRGQCLRGGGDLGEGLAAVCRAQQLVVLRRRQDAGLRVDAADRREVVGRRGRLCLPGLAAVV